MYIQNMLHLDDKVLDGILYRSCSDYDDDSITPSVNIKEIDYEQTRFVDDKLFEGCFENSDFVNILKKCLTVDFDRSNAAIEWELYREYRIIHLNNGDFYHLFESALYNTFKDFLNVVTGLLIDRIILEVHDVYPPRIPGTSSENLQVRMSESFMIDSFPEFPVIQFVVNDESKRNKEIMKKTFVNHQYERPSIKSYIIDYEKGL